MGADETCSASDQNARHPFTPVKDWYSCIA
jgi:hypothetical protein